MQTRLTGILLLGVLLNGCNSDVNPLQKNVNNIHEPLNNVIDEVNNNSKKVTLDIVSSSYIGGNGFDRIQSVYIDHDGYIYVAGNTSSTNFPVTRNAYQRVKKGPAGTGSDTQEGFVMKLTPDGSKIVWSTYIGGKRRDQVYAVRTDSKKNVYILGTTGSEDFPATPGVYDESFNGPIGSNYISDIFVASLTPDGSGLRFSTFIGGAKGHEENPRGAFEIDEKNGKIYVAGQTSASDFPVTENALQGKFGGGSEDAIIFVLSIDGKKLLASTFFGGSGSDSAFTEIELHPSGDSIYIAGATNSPDFPVSKNAFQTRLKSGHKKKHWWEGGDAFIARLSTSLDRIIFSTYYGGSNKDSVSHNQGIAVSNHGYVVVSGSTKSTDLPVTKGSYDSQLDGKSDGYIAIFTETGMLARATYFGGTKNESSVSGLFLDKKNNIYITGATNSEDYPVTNDAFKKQFSNTGDHEGVFDAYITVFSPGLDDMYYSTYLGGSGTIKWGERGRSIWINNQSRLVIGGATDSSDFPVTQKAIQSHAQDDVDGFFSEFKISPAAGN